MGLFSDDIDEAEDRETKRQLSLGFGNFDPDDDPPDEKVEKGVFGDAADEFEEKF